MSWRASGYVKELRQCPNGEFLTPYEKFIALVLADSHQDKTDAYTFPALSTLANDAGISPRHCRRLLDSLESKGVIRRIRPETYGSGRLTFYEFPALDGEKMKGNSARGKKNQKGGQGDPLFLARKGTERGQKGDNGNTPLLEEQEQERKNINPPSPLGRGGRRAYVPEVARAVEQVMSACSFTSPRLANDLLAVVQLAVDKGEPAPTVALEMVAAWKLQAERGHLLRVKFGPKNFFEGGMWKEPNAWNWDHEAIAAAQRRF